MASHSGGKVSGSLVKSRGAFLLFPQTSDGSVQAFLEFRAYMGDGANAVEISGCLQVGEPRQKIVPDVVSERSRDVRQGAFELFDEFVKGVAGGALECGGGGWRGAALGRAVKAVGVIVRSGRRSLGSFLG